MPTQKPQLKTYVHETTYNKFKILAEYEHRSTSNYLELLITTEIKRYESEHGEIKINE